MQPNIILVDYENVQPETLGLVVSGPFHVVLFIGAGQKCIRTDVVTGAQAMGDRAELVRVTVAGRDALDSVLDFNLGCLASAHPEAHFHIISKDKGYDAVVAHMKERGFQVARWPEINHIPLLRAEASRMARERALLMQNHLSRPGVTRPRTQKKLGNAVAHFFRNKLSVGEVKNVILRLSAPGCILSIKDGKVVFHESAFAEREPPANLRVFTA